MLSRFHRFGYCRALAVWVASLLAVSLVGCQPPRDDYAEFLLEQRNKAIQQLERKAARDKTLDILCWDISSHTNKPNTIKKWATSQKGLDVLALSGPNLKQLKQAADMAEVVNSLDRGWPVVTSSNELPAGGPATGDASGEQVMMQPDVYSVMNANGYRFDGVIADEIEGWQPPAAGQGRVDPPSILHLQVRYTQYEAILVYLTHCDAISDAQWKSLANWIDEQDDPVIIFGQFDANRLNSLSLVTVDPARLAVSKSIQSWQFTIEELQSPLVDGVQPYMIHCVFSP